MRPPQSDVVVPPPGAHGGDARALAAALGVAPCEILDLSATMNPFAPDVVRFVRNVAEEVRAYPDSGPATAALAAAIGVEPGRIILTNGGSEAIALVANEMGQALVVEPEFSLWRRHLATVESDPTGASGRVRSNPNNPLGTLAGAKEAAAVWDEAFFPLATGQWTRGDAERGAIVVGSLTKLFACPGLRLGYVLVPDAALTDRIAARQPLWSVNALALGVLPALVDLADLTTWARDLAKLRAELVAILSGNGFVVTAGDAPWVLVHEAAWLRDRLGREGVLVRDCANFGLAGTVRIAVPGADDLARLAMALDRVQER